MATRIHFRYVASDSAGNVVQNAKVFVYQPGTTTDFTGLAYAAKTGGSSIANGFVTNNQGEAEAWFDTPQTIDVKLTDNSGTAFYPASPTVSRPFTALTEANWDLEAAREDQPTAIGTTTDLQDITVAAQTEVIGTSGRWAPADHVHGHVDLQSGVDTSRKFFLPAGAAVPDVATQIVVGTGVNSSGAINLADGATNSADWNFTLPDWASGALLVQPVWTPGSTDGVAHTVRWEYAMKSVVAGGDITAAGTTVLWTGASATRTVNIVVYDTDTSTTFTPASATDVLALTVSRIGADGADSYVGAVRLLGVLVSYTATH